MHPHSYDPYKHAGMAWGPFCALMLVGDPFLMIVRVHEGTPLASGCIRIPISVRVHKGPHKHKGAEGPPLP